MARRTAIARWAATTMLAGLMGVAAPVTMAAAAAADPPAPAAAAGKPNILFVLVDDMGFGDLSVMGNRRSRPPISIGWRAKAC